MDSPGIHVPTSDFIFLEEGGLELWQLVTVVLTSRKFQMSPLQNLLTRRFLMKGISTQLFGLVDEDGRKKIILDFSNVEYLSSAALGKLITLDKKVKKAKGKLKLCSIRPDIYEVFAITRLNQLFDIAETQEAALEGF